MQKTLDNFNTMNMNEVNKPLQCEKPKLSKQPTVKLMRQVSGQLQKHITDQKIPVIEKQDVHKYFDDKNMFY